MATSSSSAFSEPFSSPADGNRRIPEDTVFFSIYLDEASSSSSSESLFSHQLHIVDSIVSPLVQDYIWQHEPFNLSLNSAGIPHLRGKIRYGDNVDDEWFVVFLLYEISRRVPSASIRVWDSDGEFLLIEAAFSLPRWINPGNSENRIFIRRGNLHIIPKKHFPSNPTLEQSLAALASRKIQTVAPDDVQEAVKRRLSDYPARARRSMHRARVRVPLPVAQVLKHEPSLISLAVEGFYDRDIDSMKHASRMEKFLLGEGGAVDVVRVSVVMSRAMYAQLARQSFSAPKCYPMPSRDQGSALYAEAELGMKIACGMEMMYQSRVQSGHEIKCVGSVEAFKKALAEQGYFEGLLPGSKEYRRRMDEAMERHKDSVVFARSRDVMSAPVRRIEEILQMTHSAEDFLKAELPPGDDDSWMYDGEEELNSAIMERQKEMEIYESKPRGKEKPESGQNSGEDLNLREMAKTMQSFVEKISSFEGAEVPASRREVELDVEMFIKDMESVLGEFSGTREDSEEDEASFSSDIGSDDWEEEEGESEADAFMDSYSESLEKELGDTTLQKSFARAEHAQGSSKTEGEEEEMAPVDVDLNLVKGLIDSFASQQGLPGPASNLLGLMGFNLPPDASHSS